MSTVIDLFQRRVSLDPLGEAFRFPRKNGWGSLDWQDVARRVRAIACGLHELGLKPEQRCVILSSTRVEWILADLAILCAGGATTTIYPSSTPEECGYIVRDSGAVVAFVENAAQAEKLTARRAELVDLSRIILFDGESTPDRFMLSLADLEAMGQDFDHTDPGHYERAAAAVTPDSLATLVYTSGTTGLPKGVELTHDAWVYEAEAIDGLGVLSSDDLHYLWLPLAHVFGKVLEMAQLRIGFRSAVDGRIDKLMDNLAELRPSFMCAVPRIFEKLHSRMIATVRSGSPLRARLFDWAFHVGRRTLPYVQKGQPMPSLLALEHRLAHKLVFSKMQAHLGGRARFLVSGSAPLSREVAEFFHAGGVLICEGYGLTESAAASFVNVPHRYRLGSVGRPLPGTEVKIAEEDGEILLRGRGIMRGYHGLPEATKEALDGDGWLHTGDIGVLDADGFLRVTDRKKELIKTSGGKYIAPQALEGKIKALSPYVSQVVVSGDTRPYAVALVTLDFDSLRLWVRNAGLGDLAPEEMAAHPAVRGLIQGALDELNRGQASYATIKKFVILPRDLTIEAGELTANFKVKRKLVEKKYRNVLDALYATPGERRRA
jgi:long-chain acyl-CoA synthetase